MADDFCTTCRFLHHIFRTTLTTRIARAAARTAARTATSPAQRLAEPMEMGNEHGFSVSFHFPFPVEMGNENENSAKIPEMGNENGALTLLATQLFLYFQRLCM